MSPDYRKGWEDAMAAAWAWVAGFSGEDAADQMRSDLTRSEAIRSIPAPEGEMR